jgi:hypothetical protein
MEPSLTDLAASLCAVPIPVDALTTAVSVVRGGGGARLLKALLDRSKTIDSFPIRKVMTTLERIVPLNAELGIYLMCKLYPLAGKREHAVFNAIELWARATVSIEAIQGLELAAQESGPLFRKRFEEWSRAARVQIVPNSG